MAQIDGAQLVGDVFLANQLSRGFAAPEQGSTTGAYVYSPNGSLVGTLTSIKVVSSDPSPSPNFKALITGGSLDGQTVSGTLLANDSSDLLASLMLGGSTVNVYATNDPAAQPATGQTIEVGGIGPNNPYTYQQEACFVSGTLIRTSQGDVAVEHLQVGDLIVTAAGAQRPIRWLGHRTIDGHRLSRSQDALPIRISAHAFGESCPARDLFVSRAHAICVDVLGEVLIPACALVNGSTVQQIAVDEVTYWHVELDAHDVILSENLPSESYIDCGNRSFFAEAAVTALDALPDARSTTTSGFCRPFHTGGDLVELVRNRLHARAEALSRQEQPLRLAC